MIDPLRPCYVCNNALTVAHLPIGGQLRRLCARDAAAKVQAVFYVHYDDETEVSAERRLLRRADAKHSRLRGSAFVGPLPQLSEDAAAA